MKQLLTLCLLCAVFFSGCAPGSKTLPDTSVPAQAHAQKIQPSQALLRRLADKTQQDPQAFQTALTKNLRALRTKKRTGKPLLHLGLHYTWKDLVDSLEHLQKGLPALAQDPELLTRDFIWYKLPQKYLVTGYYEQELSASWHKTPFFTEAVYGLPPDLQSSDLGLFKKNLQGQTLVYRLDKAKKIVPYFTRAEITQGALAHQKPIVWVHDPIELFFLHIQGSGHLRFPDGSTTHILYAGKNGHPYVSLGKSMHARGLLSKNGISLQSIRAFLRAHPHQQQELFNTNPSYVFFRLGESGPYGALGQILTPMVSVATDPDLLPLGSLLVLETALPQSSEQDSDAFLALAQDKGGAIQGARLDLFCGAGKHAEMLAGHLQHPGQVYVFFKKPAVSQKD